MTCPSPAYSGVDLVPGFWANWIGRVSGMVERLTTPSSLPDLVNIVQQAEAAGRELRVFGSGWAFEDLAFSPQWQLSLDLLNKRLTAVTDHALTDDWRRSTQNGGPDVLVHVEAGIKVAALNDMLFAAGLAMPTLGGSNGQSVAGAISTGTHGADFELPPLAGLVMAMHVVSVGGQEYWVEPASRPITENVALAWALDCGDAQIIRDDEMFNALLVSVGRFGVIYSYVLRAVPAFRIAEWTAKIPRVVLTTLLRQGVAAGTFLRPLLDSLPPPPTPLGVVDVPNPRGLEVVFDTQNTDACWVKRRWTTNDPSDLHHMWVEDEACRIGARGVLDQIKPVLTDAAAIAAATGIVFPLAGPIYAILVATKIVWLEDQLRASPNMTSGDMLALILRVAWDLNVGFLVGQQTAKAFGDRYVDTTTDGIRGASAEMLSGFPQSSQQKCFRAESAEPIFDAHALGYLNFLDTVVAFAPTVKQAGYISLRWSMTTPATLSMHNFPSAHAVAIEVTSLKGLPDNETWMTTLMTVANANGGRLHWGQRNSFVTGALVATSYGSNLTRWRTALTAMTGAGAVFSCNFTRMRTLEPNSTAAVPTLAGPRLADLRAAVLTPIMLLLADDPPAPPKPKPKPRPKPKPKPRRVRLPGPAPEPGPPPRPRPIRPG